MPCTPSASTRLACSRHHALGCGRGEVDRRAGAHPPAATTHGSPSGAAHEVAVARALLVVGRRLAVQALGLGVGRRAGRRRSRGSPTASPTPPCARRRARMRAISPGASGNWCGLNSHVLYCVSHGESMHDRVERQPCSAGSPRSRPRRRAGARRRRGSSSARTPTRAAAPGASVDGAQERAQARGRACAAVNRCRRSGPAAARAEISISSPSVELRAVPVGLQPRRPAARGEQPRHRRVVALRDAAEVEHVGRAVGAGVAAVGAEPRPSGRPGRRAARGGRRARSGAAPGGPGQRGRAGAPARRRVARRSAARGRRGRGRAGVTSTPRRPREVERVAELLAARSRPRSAG